MSYNQGLLQPGVLQLGFFATWGVTTRGCSPGLLERSVLTTRNSYNQGFYNEGSYNQGVLESGLLQSGALQLEVFTNRVS